MSRPVLVASSFALLALASGVAAAQAVGILSPEPGLQATPAFKDSVRRQKLAQALPAIEARAAYWLKRSPYVGLAYGIVIDGELVVARGLGFRDLASKAPVEPETVFRIASMTKSFTALAILQLRDAGKLALDDPVAKHVPELAALRVPTRDSVPVTIRHLLTHSAGFPEDNPSGDRQLGMTRDQFTELLRRGVPFASAPGSQFEYSNLGFAILGRVVTHVSGMPYRSYVQREILDPLGMSETYWSSAAVPRERLATGYRPENKDFAIDAVADGGDGEYAAMGALLTSSRDLAKWVGLMLSAFPARDDPERPPALRRTLREMQQGSGPHFAFPGFYLPIADRRMPGMPLSIFDATAGFGLFHVRDCRFNNMVGHSGGLPGFGSLMQWLPEHGVGVFAMSNTTYGAPASLVDDIVALLAKTGGLVARAAPPAPALVRAVNETALLVDSWDDERARRIAAPNLFLDEPLEARRDAIRKLREGLGRCSAEPIAAENALRGRFRMTCENGWLDAELTLAPSIEPQIQALKVTGVRPPSDGLRRFIDDVTRSIATGGDQLRLAPDVTRQVVGAVLENARVQYGTCRVESVVESDGIANASSRLRCDRGDLILSLRIEDQRLAKLTLAPPEDGRCVP